MENRKYVDCREQDAGKSGCSLRISGNEKEVTDAAFLHAVSVYGFPDTDETRFQITNSLKDDSENAPFSTPSKATIFDEKNIAH